MVVEYEPPLLYWFEPQAKGMGSEHLAAFG